LGKVVGTAAGTVVGRVVCKAVDNTVAGRVVCTAAGSRVAGRVEDMVVDNTQPFEDRVLGEACTPGRVVCRVEAAPQVVAWGDPPQAAAEALALQQRYYTS